MATNYNNDIVRLYSGDVNVSPDPYTTGTGTFSTSGQMVYGTNTLFLSEIGGNSLFNGIGHASSVVPHAYLFWQAGAEVRKIKEVISDTQLVLENSFSGNIISQVAVLIVPGSRTMQMTLTSETAGGIVDGVTLNANQSVGFGYTTSNNNTTVSPVVVDSRSANIVMAKYVGG